MSFGRWLPLRAGVTHGGRPRATVEGPSGPRGGPERRPCGLSWRLGRSRRGSQFFGEGSGSGEGRAAPGALEREGARSGPERMVTTISEVNAAGPAARILFQERAPHLSSLILTAGPRLLLSFFTWGNGLKTAGIFRLVMGRPRISAQAVCFRICALDRYSLVSGPAFSDRPAPTCPHSGPHFNWVSFPREFRISVQHGLTRLSFGLRRGVSFCLSDFPPIQLWMCLGLDGIFGFCLLKFLFDG